MSVERFTQIEIPVRSYDLALTLQSGQAFRWQQVRDGWEGVIGSRWVRLEPSPGNIGALAAGASQDWSWLTGYLQTDVDLEPILASFPSDEPMRASVAAGRGLRLLRQDPWECLASFILSSCKRIVQIEQIVALLCARFGKPVTVPPGHAEVFAFPSPDRLAGCSEAELRACKMGWRAVGLGETSRRVASGEVNLGRLRFCSMQEARRELMRLPGVGPKVANCVLLFAYGCQEAFPVDVWVRKALRHLYFRGRRSSPAQLRRFAETHFGPNAGYAQQYLFHYMRTLGKLEAPGLKNRR